MMAGFAEVINVVQWILIASFGAVFFYLFFLSLMGLFVNVKREKRSSRLRTFALVIPAHNEEGTIAKTVSSLMDIAYPGDHADVYVLADNCTDHTADIASGFNGVTVLERHDQQQRGKGFALRWCFDQLLSSPRVYDAIVVIDADSVASQNFLSVMNEYLEEGHQVLQAADVPEARPELWSSEVVRIGMTLYNISRPLGRRKLKFTAGLRGNGMCFSTDVLRTVPWRAYSLTEDLEYGLDLLLNGITVTLAPEAVVLASMPNRLSGSQRERWEAGRFPVVKEYIPKLARKFRRTFSPVILDSLVDLLIPPFVNVFALAFLLSLITAGTVIVDLVDAAVLWGWGAVLFLGSAHVVLGLVAARADRHLFQALAYVPCYAVWKLTVYAHVLMYGIRKEWIRTIRD